MYLIKSDFVKDKILRGNANIRVETEKENQKRFIDEVKEMSLKMIDLEMEAHFKKN